MQPAWDSLSGRPPHCPTCAFSLSNIKKKRRTQGSNNASKLLVVWEALHPGAQPHAAPRFGQVGSCQLPVGDRSLAGEQSWVGERRGCQETVEGGGSKCCRDESSTGVEGMQSIQMSHLGTCSEADPREHRGQPGRPGLAFAWPVGATGENKYHKEEKANCAQGRRGRVFAGKGWGEQQIMGSPEWGSCAPWSIRTSQRAVQGHCLELGAEHGLSSRRPRQLREETLGEDC